MEGVGPLQAGVLGGYPRLSSFTGSCPPAPRGEGEAQVLGVGCCQQAGGYVCSRRQTQVAKGTWAGYVHCTSPCIPVFMHERCRLFADLLSL